ncbi:hypothetical protein AMECASPLE_030010 [Ameca splendens]|uniref:Uncharacterized protein n=1 Tax=Ameca splendens TaxID=208324 RepID=A0ABV1A3J6_9TELE
MLTHDWFNTRRFDWLEELKKHLPFDRDVNKHALSMREGNNGGLSVVTEKIQFVSTQFLALCGRNPLLYPSVCSMCYLECQDDYRHFSPNC